MFCKFVRLFSFFISSNMLHLVNFVDKQVKEVRLHWCVFTAGPLQSPLVLHVSE